MSFAGTVSWVGLIVCRWVATMCGFVTSCVLWLVYLSRYGGSGIEWVISSCAFLSICSLRRHGVALIRASHSEHGAKGVRRTLPAMILFGIAAVAVAKGLYDGRTALTNASDMSDLEHALTATFTNPPMGWVLYPFPIAVAPMFAPTSAAGVR